MFEQFRGNKIFDSIKDFERQKQIGIGAFSKVFLAIYKPTGKKYALKQVNLKKLKNTHEENIQKEIEIHKKLDDNNIVKFYDVFQNKQFLYLVLEYLEGGNLFSHMRKTSQLNLKSVKKYFSQCLKAIDYLHMKGIVLRDLKPENILLTKDRKTVKICDFGWASYINDKRWLKKKAGTYVYMAPEALNGHLQGFETDIWALGILLFEMLYDREPYPGSNCKSVNQSIKIGIDFSGRDISENLKQLILDILKIRMDRRISIDSLILRFNNVIDKEMSSYHHKRVYSSNYSNNINISNNYFANNSNISNFIEKKNICLKENKTFYKGFPNKCNFNNDYKKKYCSIDKTYKPQSQKLIHFKNYSINKKKKDPFLNFNLKRNSNEIGSINNLDSLRKNSDISIINNYLNGIRKNSNDDYIQKKEYDVSIQHNSYIRNININNSINTNNSLICENEKKTKKSIKKYDLNINYIKKLDKIKKKHYSIDKNYKNISIPKNVSIDNFSILNKNIESDYLMSSDNYLLKKKNNTKKKMVSSCLNINKNLSFSIFDNYKLDNLLNDEKIADNKYISEKFKNNKRKKKFIKINKREDYKTFSKNDFKNLSGSTLELIKNKNFKNQNHTFINKEIIYHKLKEPNNNLKNKFEDKKEMKKKNKIKQNIELLRSIYSTNDHSNKTSFKSNKKKEINQNKLNLYKDVKKLLIKNKKLISKKELKNKKKNKEKKKKKIEKIKREDNNSYSSKKNYSNIEGLSKRNNSNISSKYENLLNKINSKNSYKYKKDKKLINFKNIDKNNLYSKKKKDKDKKNSALNNLFKNLGKKNNPKNRYLKKKNSSKDSRFKLKVKEKNIESSKFDYNFPNQYGSKRFINNDSVTSFRLSDINYFAK